MSKILGVVVVLLLVVVGGGAVFLATWDIPPPTRTIEAPVADDRFPR